MSSAYLFLGMSSDFPPGRYRCREIFGHHLVVGSDPHNGIVVADNICEHRGFPPAAGTGNLPVRCRYHGQRFEFRRRYQVVKKGPLVFFSREAFQPETSEELELVIDQLGSEFDQVVTDVRAPFQLWVQNTMDPHHVPVVHQRFVSNFKTLVPEDVRLQELVSSYRIPLRSEVVEKYRRWSDVDAMADFLHVLVFPNLSLTMFANTFISIETAEPTAIGSRITTRFFTTSSTTVPDTVIRFAKAANRKILEEDREIIEAWAQGSEIRHQQWLPGEERIRWYLRKLKEEKML